MMGVFNSFAILDGLY